ncbi:MAG: NAD(P)-dependent oxidoreductase [Nitrosopumilus sp.]|nr:NAD(P)-dependent oxidoreductase [Nitrosopumilus sp.]MDF2422840.1 NAD(P)-dependent oxidoreductase [Nitrosopumilus sp.]MDF2424435.1 NAD(P)-dependent oxidoreductase [Nitrosopumilus sp.]MDF2425111.1 NAD(P)-dependent oxidoreductase [Nitrosopumilus sp.]MDF2427290.1 NAD(P)-dependent oxidoreductase [Nitrosopumilus sp.]
MKRIGVVGLGILGNAVALRLVDAGFEVTAYNRTKEKTFELKDKGATIAESPRKVAENSELVIIVVKDADAVKQVSFGNEGIANGNHEKLIVADMSTIDPSESKNISKQFNDSGITKLDIPVMGGPNVAITGDLVMMASGNKESFEKCKKVFDTIANKVFFLGESGVANSVKLAMNLQITMLALALSEGITLVKKSNVDPKIFLEILNSTYFKTGMSEKKAYGMIDGKYDTTFTLSNLKKDISTITGAAKSLGIELPMISKAEEVYENAIKEGFGDIDYTGIIEYLKKINK